MKCGPSILLLGALLFGGVFPPIAMGQIQPPPTQADAQSNSPLARLNLTPEQQKQVANIEDFLRANMKTILTPEQFLQVQARQNAGQDPDWAALQLSQKQRKEIQEAEGLAAYRLNLLLTDAQKKQLAEIIKSQR